MSLLLVDGNNLLFRAFFGFPERLRADGKPIQGVIGFSHMLSKMVRIAKATHTLVAFDPVERHTRRDLLEDYKQNRPSYRNKPDRENPFSQFDDILATLTHLAIPHIQQSGYEADDVIASMALRAAAADIDVVIGSSDTDFLQLVSDRIMVMRYQGENSFFFTKQSVEAKFGVPPSQYLAYKALVGDKADNIPGAGGIGPKTALKVLRGERILNEEEQAIFERNKELIAFQTDMELPMTFEELHMPVFPNGSMIAGALRELGMV